MKNLNGPGDGAVIFCAIAAWVAKPQPLRRVGSWCRNDRSCRRTGRPDLCIAGTKCACACATGSRLPPLLQRVDAWQRNDRSCRRAGRPDRCTAGLPGGAMACGAGSRLPPLLQHHDEWQRRDGSRAVMAHIHETFARAGGPVGPTDAPQLCVARAMACGAGLRLPPLLQHHDAWQRRDGSCAVLAHIHEMFVCAGWPAGPIGVARGAPAQRPPNLDTCVALRQGSGDRAASVPRLTAPANGVKQAGCGASSGGILPHFLDFLHAACNCTSAVRPACSVSFKSLGATYVQEC